MEESVLPTRAQCVDAAAPVALFVHRRPDHVRRLLESLTANSLAPRTTLYIFSDAPARPEQRKAVGQVRRLVRQFTGCAEVRVVERQEHFGLAASILAGVDQVLREHEQIIVLEDDLELAPTFLEYVNKALNHYHDVDRVMQISGYAFPLEEPRRPKENYFLPVISSWGWATWRRAWRHFDAQASGGMELETNEKLRRRFDVGGAYPYSQLLQGQRQGRFDTWAVRWYWSVFQRGGVTLFPPVSLVRNTGWDGSGTHCQSGNPFDGPLAREWRRAFPEVIATDASAYLGLQELFQRVAPTLAAVPSGIWTRVRQWLRGMLGQRELAANVHAEVSAKRKPAVE